MKPIHAFPSTRDMRFSPESETDPGMTLRDYFAAKALQGQVAHWNDTSDADLLAARCYSFADAMLKAREVKR